LISAMANYAIYVTPIPREIENNTPEGKAIRTQAGLGIQKTKGREFNTLGTVLGLCYENSPLIEAESGLAPVHDSAIYHPSARPGCLAPHAWLADHRSLYDLFGQDFALVATVKADAAEIDKALQEARELGVPLALVQPRDVPIHELYGADLTLVRPDQHVVWRGNKWTGVLARAIGRPWLAGNT
jgi:hypothetical protein